MKVWGMDWMGRYRRIVAADSKKRAAELIGVSLYHFNAYASETGNCKERMLATQHPETVFETADEYRVEPIWHAIPPK